MRRLCLEWRARPAAERSVSVNLRPPNYRRTVAGVGIVIADAPLRHGDAKIMSQGDLFAQFGPPPRRPVPSVRATDRLFFAIFANEAGERIHQCALQLCAQHSLTGKPLATDRFHVTLCHLGDYVGDAPPEIVVAALRAGDAVKASPFAVGFDRAVSFGRRRKAPLVLRGSGDNAPLMAFHRDVGAAMMQAGLGQWINPRFTPHVTLLYDDRNVTEQPVEPVSWTVREFVLIRSLLGQTRHIALGRWPLRG
jgi:2'-5' RNA ligase